MKHIQFGRSTPLNLLLLIALIFPMAGPLPMGGVGFEAWGSGNPTSISGRVSHPTSGTAAVAEMPASANVATNHVFLPLVTRGYEGGGAQVPGGAGGTSALDPLPAAERLHLFNLGWHDWSRYRGDPVNTATGNHLQQFTDLRVPGLGGFGFTLERTYNSFDGRDGLFGLGWSSLLDMNLRLASDGSVDVRYADGSGATFLPAGTQYTPAQGGVFDILTRSGSDFYLTKKDQTVYHFLQSGDVAPLTSVSDRHGNQILISRDGTGRPTQVTDSAGRLYALTLSGARISAISDPLGRQISYSYDGLNNLIAVTDANGGTTQFTYENIWLTTLTDPEGFTYLENIYDSSGRVVEQIDANGSHAFFAYASGQTTYTDYLGNQTQDFYDALFRVTQTIDALGNQESFIYDGDNNVIRHTDKRGNVRLFSFDARGNLLFETNPLGFVTSRTYNATNDLTTFTDFGGFDGQARTTTTVYDGQGNPIQVIRPDGSSLTATFDAFGQRASQTDANGNTTTYVYDGAGNLIQETDPLGNGAQATYDAVGRRLSRTDANGHTTSFVYDNNDNLVQIIDPKGNASAFVYDLNDNLIQTTDRRGGVSWNTYDASRRLISESDPEGHTTSYAYDAMSNRTSVTNANGHVTRTRYDALQRSVEVENALGGVTGYEYDANGNLLAMTDALGQKTRFTYDALDRRMTATDPLGGLTIHLYDEVSRLLVTIDPDGGLTRYQYDLLDRLIRMGDPLGSVWQMSYDPVGNLVQRIDANGFITAYAYDAVNRLVLETDPEGHTNQFVYDPVGNLIQSADGLGRVTSYAYDENNLLISTTDALGGITTYQYDAEENLVARTDANGHTTHVAYNLDNLAISLTEAGGQATTFEYDPAHNQIALTNAKGNRWVRSYDALSRLVSEIDPLGFVTTHDYDALGRLMQLTDANGFATGYEYDPMDRLTAVVQNTQPGQPADHETNVTTRYTYDVGGHLTAIADANGHITSFSYDLLNRVVQETDPLGHTWQYQYDFMGNLLQRIDARGMATDYAYNGDGQLVSIAYPDGTGVVYEYDAAHNQVRMTDWLGTTNNSYDALNRLVSSSNHLGQSIGYTYDAVGNRSSLTGPNGDVALYEYDETNFQVRVIDPAGNVFQAMRDATHNLREIAYPNQTTAVYTLDAADRLVSVRNYSGGDDAVSSFAYSLDAVGNRLRVEEEYAWRQPGELIHEYEYDPLYRLVRSEDHQGNITTYSYDSVGNRLQMVTNDDPTLAREVDWLTTSYTYNEANQLLTATTTPGRPALWATASQDGRGHGDDDNHPLMVTHFTYDENGNRIQRLIPGSGRGETQDTPLSSWGDDHGRGRDWLRTDYVYDAENRLVQVEDFRDPRGKGHWQELDTTVLTYDGYGRLFRRLHDQHIGTGGEKWQEYLYDGLDPIAEYLVPSGQTRSYLRGLDRLLSTDDGTGEGQGSLVYFYYDGLGSVTGLAKHRGQGVHNYRYNDFGILIDVNGRADDSSNFTSPHNLYTFTGREWDEHTELYHFYARQYDPQTGTWLQQDPYRGRLLEPATLHRYAYVANNPINLRDPFGFDRRSVGATSIVETRLFTDGGEDPSLWSLPPGLVELREDAPDGWIPGPNWFHTSLAGTNGARIATSVPELARWAIPPFLPE